MLHRWKQSDRDAARLLAPGVWWLRAVVFVVAAVVVLTASGRLAVKGAELAIAAVALLGWWLGSRLPAPWARRSEFVCLTVIGAVGCLAATSPHDTSLLALALLAMLAAGADLALGELLFVFLVGAAAVEIGAAGYGDTGLATMLWYPVLLAGLVLAGRYRRAYRMQSEQANALLVETRRATFEAERAAALMERSRIAREIHDVLAHSLGALGIQLQAAEAMLSERGDFDRAVRSLATARRLVDEGLTETQRAIRALRTDAPPLPDGIAALLGGRPERLTVSGQPYALSPAAGLALLRVAQEAFANAAKHGNGSLPGVALDYGDAGVELRVENLLPDRQAINPPDRSGGYGLAGMHERLRLVGGELQAGPVGDRWVVRARVSR